MNLPNPLAATSVAISTLTLDERKSVIIKVISVVTQISTIHKPLLHLPFNTWSRSGCDLSPWMAPTGQPSRRILLNTSSTCVIQSFIEAIWRQQGRCIAQKQVLLTLLLVSQKINVLFSCSCMISCISFTNFQSFSCSWQTSVIYIQKKW